MLLDHLHQGFLFDCKARNPIRISIQRNYRPIRKPLKECLASPELSEIGTDGI
jgi:hypothetical protein